MQRGQDSARLVNERALWNYQLLRLTLLLILSVLLDERLQLATILRRHEILPRRIRPADAVGEVLLLLDLEHIDGGVDVPLGDLMPSGDERLERDDAATLLQIEEEVNQVIVELRRESLVVDEDDIGLGQDLADLGTREEVATFEMHVARRETPGAAAGAEFFFLERGQIAGVVHNLAAPTLATNLEGSLQNDVAHTRTEVDKDLVGGQAGLLEDHGCEAWQKLAVDVVGAVFILAERINLERHRTGVDLRQDVLHQLQGQLTHFVQIIGDGIVVIEGLDRLVVVGQNTAESVQQLASHGELQLAVEPSVLVDEIVGLVLAQVEFRYESRHAEDLKNRVEVVLVAGTNEQIPGRDLGKPYC